jgi:hypothetical protein
MARLTPERLAELRGDNGRRWPWHAEEAAEILGHIDALEEEIANLTANRDDLEKHGLAAIAEREGLIKALGFKDFEDRGGRFLSRVYIRGEWAIRAGAYGGWVASLGAKAVEFQTLEEALAHPLADEAAKAQKEIARLRDLEKHEPADVAQREALVQLLQDAEDTKAAGWEELGGVAALLGYPRGESPDFGEVDVVEVRELARVIADRARAPIADRIMEAAAEAMRETVTTVESEQGDFLHAFRRAVYDAPTGDVSLSQAAAMLRDRDAAAKQAFDALELEMEARMKAERALDKISKIRDSIVGHQRVYFSEHVYPLVAALEEAGVHGVGYDAARPAVLTLHEQLKAAEERAEAAEAARVSAEKERDSRIEQTTASERAFIDLRVASEKERARLAAALMESEARADSAEKERARLGNALSSAIDAAKGAARMLEEEKRASHVAHGDAFRLQQERDDMRKARDEAEANHRDACDQGIKLARKLDTLVQALDLMMLNGGAVSYQVRDAMDAARKAE